MGKTSLAELRGIRTEAVILDAFRPVTGRIIPEGSFMELSALKKRAALAKSTFFEGLTRLIRKGIVEEIYLRNSWPRRLYRLSKPPVLFLRTSRTELGGGRQSYFEDVKADRVKGTKDSTAQPEPPQDKAILEIEAN